jgi:hypothetical protein
MWKQIIDHKYKTNSPNVFACLELGLSPFLERGDVGSEGSKNGISMESWGW